ncbi:MAG: diacylglycerol kinase family protein [Thermoanaerobaculia bacterium]|nr:diacylglycerol kinase family protein [Thermoanaerobaculia bacterium]
MIPCVIFNPGAGNGRESRILDFLQNRAEVRRTDGPGHATELAGQAVEDGFTTLVAVGGMVEKVDEKITPKRKEIWGPLAYFGATATTLTALEPYRVQVISDQEELELEAHVVAVCNGRWVAGGTPIAPNTFLDDGTLDCVVIRAVRGLDIAVLGARVLIGSHLDPDPDERIAFIRCRDLHIESRPRLGFHVDGEKFEGHSVRFRVRPGALPVIHGPSPQGLSGTDGR